MATHHEWKGLHSSRSSPMAEGCIANRTKVSDNDPSHRTASSVEIERRILVVLTQSRMPKLLHFGLPIAIQQKVLHHQLERSCGRIGANRCLLAVQRDDGIRVWELSGTTGRRRIDETHFLGVGSLS